MEKNNILLYMKDWMTITITITINIIIAFLCVHRGAKYIIHNPNVISDY